MELTTETRRALATNALDNRPHIVVESATNGQTVSAFGTAIVADAMAQTLREISGAEVTQFDLSAGRGAAFNAQAYSLARRRSGV